MVSTEMASASSLLLTCMCVIGTCCIVLFLLQYKRKNRNEEEMQKAMERKNAYLKKLKIINEQQKRVKRPPPSRNPPPRPTTPYNPAPPPETGKTDEQERIKTAWEMFEFDNTKPVPASYEQFPNIRFVGRTLDIKPYTNDASACAQACHSNKFCTHYEVIPEGSGASGRCVFKNRQMALVDGIGSDMINFLGIEPLPECVGKKCMDGYKEGVTTMAHPERMAYSKEGGAKNMEIYRKVEDMFVQMKKSTECNTLCKVSNALGIASIVLFFAGGVTSILSAMARAAAVSASAVARVGTAFAILDAGLFASEIGVAIPATINGIKDQKKLDQALKTVFENPGFIYHNIKGDDIKEARKGIECLQYCEEMKGVSPLMFSAVLQARNDAINSSPNAAQTWANRRRLTTQCCSYSDPKRRSSCESTGGAFGHTDMCDRGNAYLDSVKWNSLPEEPNNFTPMMYDFFRLHKINFLGESDIPQT